MHVVVSFHSLFLFSFSVLFLSKELQPTFFIFSTPRREKAASDSTRSLRLGIPGDF